MNKLISYDVVNTLLGIMEYRKINHKNIMKNIDSRDRHAKVLGMKCTDFHNLVCNIGQKVR